MSSWDPPVNDVPFLELRDPLAVHLPSPRAGHACASAEGSCHCQTQSCGSNLVTTSDRQSQMTGCWLQRLDTLIWYELSGVMYSVSPTVLTHEMQFKYDEGGEPALHICAGAGSCVSSCCGSSDGLCSCLSLCSSVATALHLHGHTDAINTCC